MAVWLIAKGFNPTAIAAQPAGEASRWQAAASGHCFGSLTLVPNQVVDGLRALRCPIGGDGGQRLHEAGQEQCG